MCKKSQVLRKLYKESDNFYLVILDFEIKIH